MKTYFDLDQIKKEATPEILSRYYNVELTPKTDNGNVVCVCSGCKNKKKPSMTVKKSPFLVHCKRCGFKGSAIDVVMEIVGISQSEAIKQLAQILGINPHANRDNMEEWVNDYISSADKASDLISYFKRHRFINKETLERCGQIIIENKEQKLAVPMKDEKGKIIGWQRVSKDKKQFAPSSSLGLFYDEIKTNKELYIVEGVTDYLTMKQAGFDNVVGLSTVNVKTAMVNKIIKKISPDCQIFLSLDYDGFDDAGNPRNPQTGFAGAKKTLDIASKSKRKCFIKFASMSKKMDINDLFVTEGELSIKKMFLAKQDDYVALRKVLVSIAGERIDHYIIGKMILEKIDYCNFSEMHWLYEDGTWRVKDVKDINNIIIEFFEFYLGLPHKKEDINAVRFYIESSCRTESQMLEASMSQPKLQERMFGDCVFFEDRIYNVITRKCVDYEPSMYITRKLSMKYEDLKDGCPNFLKFIDSIFHGLGDKDDVIDFVQEIFGYMLSPFFKYQKMFLLHGSGGNGKGVFVNVLYDLLGEKNVVNKALSILNKDPAKAPASLFAKYANIITEEDKGSMLDSSIVKSLTGGDKITSRFLFKNDFTFHFTGKFIISCNSKPDMQDSGGDHMKRRLVAIPFINSFKGSKCDPNLSQKLEREKYGIMLWALTGLERMQVRGSFPEMPTSIQNFTDRYLESNDIVRFTLNKCDQKKIKTDELYDLYKSFAKRNYGKSKKELLTFPDFEDIIRKRGIEIRTESSYTGMGDTVFTDFAIL